MLRDVRRTRRAGFRGGVLTNRPRVTERVSGRDRARVRPDAVPELPGVDEPGPKSVRLARGRVRRAFTSEARGVGERAR